MEPILEELKKYIDGLMEDEEFLAELQKIGERLLSDLGNDDEGIDPKAFGWD